MDILERRILMLVDLHIHERTYSKDSYLSLKEIVSLAKSKGLDGVCITDHDDMGLKQVAEEYSKEIGYPIFVGVEYYSLQGDIVAFGLDCLPEGRIDAQQFVDMVKSAGGVCFSAHPFRNNNRGLEENLCTVRGLDGIEALNGSTSPEANRKALEYCKKLGIQPVGASDSHVPDKVGKYATYLPKFVNCLSDFIETFKQGECKPAIYENGKYRLVEEL